MTDPLADPIVQLALFKQSLEDMKVTLTDIRSEVRRFNDQALDRRVSTVESSLRWLARTVVGILISAPLAIIVAYLTTRGH